MFNDHTQSAGKDKTDEVSFQNGPNSCQNAQIEAFRGKLTIQRHSRATPPVKRFYLQNLDGRVAHGTEKEILGATGLSRQLFYQLKTGITEYAKRWKIRYYEENGLKKGILLHGSKRKYIIFFRNKGRIFKGTRIEFSRMTGLNRNLVYSRMREKMPIQGWMYSNQTE